MGSVLSSHKGCLVPATYKSSTSPRMPPQRSCLTGTSCLSELCECKLWEEGARRSCGEERQYGHLIKVMYCFTTSSQCCFTKRKKELQCPAAKFCCNNVQPKPTGECVATWGACHALTFKKADSATRAGPSSRRVVRRQKR